MEEPVISKPVEKPAEKPVPAEDSEPKSWRETGVKMFDVSNAQLANVKLKITEDQPKPQKDEVQASISIPKLKPTPRKEEPKSAPVDDEPVPIQVLLPLFFLTKQASYETAGDEDEPVPIEATYETA